MVSSVQTLLQEATKHYESGHIAKAISSLLLVIELERNHHQALNNLSFLYLRIANTKQALHYAQTALGCYPKDSLSHLSLANVHAELGQIDSAYVLYKKASELAPNSIDSFIGLGMCSMKLGKVSEAICFLQQTLKLNPSAHKALNNLALALQQSGDADSANRLLNEAIVRHPQQIYLISNALMNQQYMSDVDSQEIIELAKKYQQAISSQLGRFKHELHANQLNKKTRRENDKILKIGFVSADFYSHPIGFFLQSILLELKLKGIHISLFSNNAYCDEITKTLQSYVNDYCLIHQLNDYDAAQIISEKGIDVLIDLSGHTAANRLGVFALKPCALQISWLGYFATTGLKEVDLVWISKQQITPTSQTFFVEEISAHEHPQFIYSAPNYARKIAIKARSQEPDDTVVFGCFNNVSKFNQTLINTWSTILNNVDKSRLVLKWKSFSDRETRQKITQRFIANGVQPDKIEFREASPHEKMLAEYNDIDIALDPFPFSGALSTYEALWMGKPVITLYQERPVSRQTFTILRTLGYEKWCSQTPKEYISISIALAKNMKQLDAFSKVIRAQINDLQKQESKATAASLIDLCQARLSSS
jgi:predicted O-linked N-acetylglucosamine transferase (SPINDLY family)